MYAQFLFLQPATNIEDITAVIMLSDIEATKNRKNAAPTPWPVRSVALGLTAGFGQPIDARVNSHYEWTIRLLNRYMRQSVVGYDGVSPTFRWTSIQLNAFASTTHIDGTHTPGTAAVVIALGDY